MKKEEIAQIARSLYLKLPWWKRATFRRWCASNNWDVKKVYKRCIDEARAMYNEEIGEHLKTDDDQLS